MISERFSKLFFMLMFASACSGAENDFSVSIEAPRPPEARIQLYAALDVSGLQSGHFSERVVIDEIIVNIADLRLLGETPAIPVGGQLLIQEDFVLSTAPSAKLGRFPFPAHLLGEHLAVYVKIDRSVLLDSSSVVVKARLFNAPAEGSRQNLTSQNTKAIDESQTSPNPDGEPNREESPNPDGEPNRDDSEGTGSQNSELRVATADPYEDSARNAIAFELRGQDQVELVITFDPGSRMNVTLGIPARRWINERVLEEFEAALAEVRTENESPGQKHHTKCKTVVVDLGKREQRLKSNSEEGATRSHIKDYRLVDEGSGHPNTLRSP